MVARRLTTPNGLILLVVLGMLALFSLLSITYVVFASHSRISSMALARSEYRGTPSPRLLDEALRLLVRGTGDPKSAIFKHSLLEDLYGSNSSANANGAMVLKVRSELYPQQNPSLRLSPNSPQRPMILASRFLRIPIESSAQGSIEHQVYSGRVATFLDGPLAMHSFRVVASIGLVSSGTSDQFAQQHSIVIDLSEVDGSEIATSGNITLQLDEWIRRLPSGSIPSALGAQSGTSLCHRLVTSTELRDGFAILLNDVALNGHGVGVKFDGTLQTHDLAFNATTETEPPVALATLSVGLQPKFGELASGGMLDGEPDESYDAPDANDFFMAHIAPGASTPNAAIPSFHRAALLNYLVNWKDPNSYTPSDLIYTLDRLVLAAGRPLSIQVTNIRSNTPPWPARSDDRTSYIVNPYFTGNNSGSGKPGFECSPQLVLDLQNNWTAIWPTIVPQYLNWLRWLTSGPWDVDNDGDGLADSVWVDLDLPIITSQEGKLQKVLASYCVEDLDSRLDLNAMGNLAQVAATYSQATPYNLTNPGPNGVFANGDGVFLPQGLGFGSAESSLRPLFSSDAAYERFLRDRYRSSNPIDGGAGSVVDDAASQLKNRERRPTGAHGALPGLPVAVWGREALGLDRLGNPLLLKNDSLFDSTTNGFDSTKNDPYEARLMRGAYGDSPFEIADWERIFRFADWDRSSLPGRLEEHLSVAARMSVTPRSSHLRTPIFSCRSLDPNNPVDSFFEFVDVILKRRSNEPTIAQSPNSILPFDAYRQFFPIEFHRGQRLNLNRPFGNGYDDDADGQIDEPQELATIAQESYAPLNGAVDAFGPSGVLEDYTLGQTNLDPLNPTGIYSGNESRQLFARHLYCLAQLLIPLNYRFPNVAVLPTPEQRARILAQWAVNAVDFRDADAAMTRFPYDADPFGDKDPTANIRYGWEPTSGVVWGMEQPELLLTESFAMHDSRIKALPGNRNDYTQYRIPQGSLFLELFCPRTTTLSNNSNVPGAPRSLYTDRGGAMYLDLGKLSPPDAFGASVPVWRVYIGESKPIEATDTPFDRYTDTSNKHHLNYQFPTSSLSGLSFDRRPVDRIMDPSVEHGRVIVFTSGFVANDLNTPHVNSPARDHAFVNRTGDMFLKGGQYLVLGPRDATYFGSRRQTQRPPIHQPNTHRIELASNWARIFTRDPNLLALPHVDQRPSTADCLTMVAAADAPLQWPPNDPTVLSANRLIGINVSEPLPGPGYYPIPTAQLNSADNSLDPATGARGFKDLPFDAYTDLNVTSAMAQVEPFDRKSNTVGKPLENWATRDDSGEIPMPGTQADWCTAYLQRLADPEKPYDAAFNPYITVDWIPIDLTMFWGEEDAPAETKYQFASRQKTGCLPDSGTLTYQSRPFADRNRTFYSFQTLDLPQARDLRPGLDYFGAELFVDTLNRLNPADAALTLGFLNYSIELSGEPAGAAPYYTGFLGAPKLMPASLFWANRLFVNATELGLVPLSGPGQFMQEFSASTNLNPHFDPSDRSNGFSHLINWYSGQLADPSKEPTSLMSLLEMVETPSPWSDSDSHITPGDVAANPTPSDIVQASTNEALVTYRAPYNQVPSSVEPGRVNINTLADVNVFRGLMWNSIVPPTGPHNTATLAASRNSGAVPQFAELSDSRRGYTLTPPPPTGVIPNGNPNLHPDYPTEFAGVFKSSLEAGLVPDTRRDVLDKSAKNNAAQATLLRSTLAPNSPPLFFAGYAGLQPYAMTQAYPTSRISNLVTNRSNVFAVRITIGYFEYDPATGLGLEYGVEQGRAKRHRAFYVIDRSVLVGFQVGSDLNTRNAILVRRIIE